MVQRMRSAWTDWCFRDNGVHPPHRPNLDEERVSCSDVSTVAMEAVLRRLEMVEL